MSITNSCHFIGNLTKDPVVRKVNAGGEQKAVADFSIAVNTRRSKDKEKQDVVFIDCNAWDYNAERVESFLAKGDRVAVDAEYRVDVFPHKETGENVYRSRFTVREFEIIKCKKWADEDAGKSAPAASAKPKKTKPAPEPEPEDAGDEDDDSLPF